MKSTNKHRTDEKHHTQKDGRRTGGGKTNTHLAGESIIQTGSYPEGTIHNTETGSQDGHYSEEPSPASQPVTNVWLIDSIW